MLARVAVVSTYYSPVIGGAEAAARRLADFLTARGHTVVVLTRRTSRADAAEERVDGAAIVRLGPIGPRSAIGKWLFLPSAFAALVARRAACDLIVVVDQRGTGLAAWLAARLFGKPWAIQPQTTGTLDGRHPLKSGWRAAVHRLLTWPLRVVYGRADLIACITMSIVDEGRSLGVAEDRLLYVPNPVDLTLFRPPSPEEKRAGRKALGIGDEEAVCVFAGRLSREKGVRELLEAWTVIERSGRRLLLIGPDMTGHPWDLGPWARAFIAERGLTGVIPLGGQPHAEVARLMRLGDIAVLPSHFEAHPVAAVEAMSCGLPLIASRVGGVPEFVRDGENGRLVAPRDVEALARALDVAMSDHEWRGAASRAAVETGRGFSTDVVLDRFARALDRLIPA